MAPRSHRLDNAIYEKLFHFSFFISHLSSCETEHALPALKWQLINVK